MKRLLVGAALVGVTALSVTACGTNNFKDLKGVHNVHPDFIENVENMDGHPNIGFLCIHGIPVLTTTRSNAADLRVVNTPSAVAFCKSKIGASGD